MSFIEKNWNVIEAGLRAKYNTNCKKEDWCYLTFEQIDGIMNYLTDNFNDDVDIESFIDNTIVNGYGFNKKGVPLIQSLDVDEIIDNLKNEECDFIEINDAIDIEINNKIYELVRDDNNAFHIIGEESDEDLVAGDNQDILNWIMQTKQEKSSELNNNR